MLFLFLAVIGWSVYISNSEEMLCISSFFERFWFVYTPICRHGLIQICSTITSGSLFPLGCANSCSFCARCPVGWDCRIHRLHFFRVEGLLHSEYPDMTIKNLTPEALVKLELWGRQSSPLLPLLPGLLWPGVVATDRVLSSRQIELFDI